MANKFAEQRKKRNNANATEEIVEKLYEDEELIEEHIKSEPVKEKPAKEEPIVYTAPEKRKPGRPRLSEDEKELSSTYSLLLSDSMKEKMRLAAAARKMSVKKYVVMLVEDDYAKNADKYEAFKEVTEKLGF